MEMGASDQSDSEALDQAHDASSGKITRGSSGQPWGSYGVRRAGVLAWSTLGLVGMALVLLYVARVLADLWPPLIFASVIVFLLNPVVARIQHRGVHRALATALTYLLVALVLVGVGFALSPLVREQTKSFQDDWPDIRDKIDKWVDDLSERSQDTPFEFTRADIEDAFGGNTNSSFKEQLGRLRSLGLQVAHVLLVLFLGPVIAFYLLVDLPHLRRVTESLVPERFKPDAAVVGHRLNAAMAGFFRGQIVVALLVGVMCSIGLGIIGVRFWLLIGMIAGLFNMIPLVGPWIGGVPAVLVSLADGSPARALWAAGVMVVVQQIDNHFITPTVMHRAVKLHPAAVILALVVGGSIGGFAGLLFAVPATASLKILLSYLWRVHVLGEPLAQAEEEMRLADAAKGVGFVEDIFRADKDLDPTS